MTRNLEGEFDTLKDDFTKVRSDITALKDSVQGYATETVRAKFNDGKQRFDQLTESARYKSRAQLEDLAAEIEDRPLTSILVAFGAGVILGRLFYR